MPSFRINGTDEGDCEGREEREALETLKIFASFAVTLFLRDGMRSTGTMKMLRMSGWAVALSGAVFQITPTGSRFPANPREPLRHLRRSR